MHGSSSLKPVLYIVEEHCHCLGFIWLCLDFVTHGHCSAGKQTGKVTHLCKKCLNSKAVCSMKSIVLYGINQLV